MSLEVAAISGSLAVIGTLSGVGLAYHLTRKREENRLRLEEWHEAVDEVYSPLSFDLSSIQIVGTPLYLVTLEEMLKLPNKLSKAQIATSLLPLFKSQVAGTTRSQLLEEILRKKQRLIKPSTLWHDLYFMHTYLDSLEHALPSIPSRFENDPDGMIAAFQTCIEMGRRLMESVSHLRDETLNRVHSTLPMMEPSYTPFFTDQVKKEIMDMNESLFPVETPKE